MKTQDVPVLIIKAIKAAEAQSDRHWTAKFKSFLKITQHGGRLSEGQIFLVAEFVKEYGE